MDHQKIDQATVGVRTELARVEHHAVVDSTNTLALQRLADGTETPFLISADQQTAGRGRSGNSWWSPPGAIMMTLVLERTESAAELPPYSLVVGLAVRDALQALSPDVDLKVKWPNDVYLQDRKVCGILVEVPPNNRTRLVIGIGVNINNSVMSAPDELRQRVVSMRDIHGHTFCRTTVLANIVNAVQTEVLNLDSEKLCERWSEHCWLTSKLVGITRGERTDEGICQGINNTGALMLQQSNGLLAVSSGVVTRAENL
ncbi:MAG: biotin--[acetyl-CoA-carboxylase] ligase [Planctomycetaceae bacterium]